MSRKPDPAHAKKNGFREGGGPPVDKDRPDDITLRNVRLAQYILASKGTHVPSYVPPHPQRCPPSNPDPDPTHCVGSARRRHPPSRPSTASPTKSTSSNSSTQRTSRTCSGSSSRNTTRSSSTTASATTSPRTWTSTRPTPTRWHSGMRSRCAVPPRGAPQSSSG